MKILYFNHVKILAGSSRSLLEILKSIQDTKIKTFVISPKGIFSDEVKNLNIPFMPILGVAQFNNSQYSYYRGFRWLTLLREILLIPFLIVTILRIKINWGNFDIIHLNEITMLPIVFILKFFFKKTKIIVSVRSVQSTKRNLRLKFLEILAKNYVNKFIAIDKNVLNSLSDKFDKISVNNIYPASNKNYIIKKNKNFTVAMVGLIQKCKGAREFLKAAKLCKDLGYNIHFHYYGGRKGNVSFFSLNTVKKFLDIHEDIDLEIKQNIKKQGLDKEVKVFEFEKNLENIYNNFDVICFPSLLDAPGRPIFEAGFFKIPSIVSISSPHEDTFINNHTGLNIKKNDYVELVDKIIYLYKNKNFLKNFGENSYKLSTKNFNSKENGKKIKALYRKVLK